jgi:hypothetical protein
MSDAVPDPQPDEAPQPAPAARAAPTLSGWRGAAAIGFATALIVFGLLVITGPFWAPAVAPLFGGAMPASADPTLADRLTRLEAAQRDTQQKIDQAIAATPKAADATASTQQLERRIAALESKPGTSPNDINELRQQLKALENRPAAAAGDIAELRQQIKALEAKPSAAPPEMAELRQRVQQLADAQTDLANRIASLEKGEQAQTAGDPTDTALLLALLQIREAIDTGRPFAAEYDALAALAKARPNVASASAPLAEPAKSGVASRAVLIERLRGLGGAITTARPKPADADWGARAWTQLRGLVTIRRIDSAGQSAPEAAVNGAERSLAAGDLAGAVKGLEGLTGPAAEAAGPWLQMARQRLAAEDALYRVQALLLAHLGPAR